MGGNHVYSLSYVCLPGWEDRRGLFCRPRAAPALAAYGALREDYRCQAILYGTTTMLGGFADGPAPRLPRQGAPLAKEDSVNPQGQRMGQFVVSVDPKGSLAFSGPVLERKGRPAAHVIQAVTEQVDPAYLTYLRQVGVSYLFAGKEQPGLPPAAGEAGGPVRGPAADGGRRRGGELVLPPSWMRGRGEPGGGPRGGRVHHRRVQL